ncbi:Membrane-bound lytic murein transglycosylase D precursor [Mucinivorans hirudinis]|uniref:Membrane-bound lytic murein transglycosylase D n=1 Tax=Mucinivorans hirudinis TaxID=1433126 RepID=A0A060R9D1_9BACT|nr:Membrane-bound lytic murein transglycosylase D precursor [Mucinivorans hirudinis]
MLRLQDSSQGYDSLLYELRTNQSTEAFDRFYNEFIDIDPNEVDLSGALADDTYEKRLKMMATEIQLPFNQIVKTYINVYTRRNFIENILGRAQYYFPLFEEALYRHNLPMELKMLPVIESALIPKAKSSAAAVGLWQFMTGTGKSYGLEVNSFVDERCDPIKSTEAACKFLKDLYRMYGDWTLVIAAYNCGPGNVNKALKRVPNATTYWEIYNYLPRETRNYVPSFIAATYAYTFHKAHGFSPAQALDHPMAVDTLMIDRMLHFDQISTTLNIPIELIRALNPQYRIDIVPAKGSVYSLTLPQSAVTSFIERESDIYAKDTLFLAKYLNISNLNDAALPREGRSVGSSASRGSTTGTKVTYKVKKGDTLGKIASSYKVKVAEIQSWNKLRNTNVKVGQNLTIYRK